MTHQPETAVTVDALARMLSAADVEINHGDYPTWDTLAESGQKQYRQAARYLLKRLHITAPAAVSAAVAPPTQAADEAALAPLKAKARELEARRLATHRAAVLREAADRIDNEELPHDYVDMFDNGARWAARLLRRMADETATETPAPDDRRLHACIEFGTWFDRSVCAEPCGAMHTRCTECGVALDACPQQPAAGARQDGAET